MVYVKVQGLVWLPFRFIPKLGRGVANRQGGEPPFLEGGGVDERLEGGAGTAVALGDHVELGVVYLGAVVIYAAQVDLDSAGMVVGNDLGCVGKVRVSYQTTTVACLVIAVEVLEHGLLGVILQVEVERGIDVQPGAREIVQLAGVDHLRELL